MAGPVDHGTPDQPSGRAAPARIGGWLALALCIIVLTS